MRFGGGSAVYLLAYDSAKDREAWGHLGGEAKLNETSAQTAVREFNEESNCAYSVETLRTLPLGAESRADTGFVSFSMKVPFIAASKIAARDRALCKDVERKLWVWVKHMDLVNGLEPTAPEGQPVPVFNGPLSTVTLWPKSARAMAGLLMNAGSPVSDPCQSSR